MAPPIQFTTKMRKAFLDAKKVQASVDKGKRKAMIKSLAYIRREWRKFLKFRSVPSQPGQPPHVHKRGLGLKTIFFHYDSTTNNGVVGPVKLTGFGSDDNEHPLPGLLEEGGWVKFPSGWQIRQEPRPSGGQVFRQGVQTGNVIDPFRGMME